MKKIIKISRVDLKNENYGNSKRKSSGVVKNKRKKESLAALLSKMTL